MRLTRATQAVQEATPALKEMFDALFEEGETYRCVMVVLEKMEPGGKRQYELFDDPVRIESLTALSAAVDAINERFGKHKVSLGQSLYLERHAHTPRDEKPWRRENTLKGETPRRHLKIPRLDIKV